MTFKVSIDTKRVKELVECGMECGGYGDFVIVGYEPKGIRDHEDVKWPHIDVPFVGGAVLMCDRYGDSTKTYRLTAQAIQRGLDILQKKYPHHIGNFMSENEDVITGTALIQCALLGDIVYG